MYRHPIGGEVVKSQALLPLPKFVVGAICHVVARDDSVRHASSDSQALVKGPTLTQTERTRTPDRRSHSGPWKKKQRKAHEIDVVLS